VLAIRSGGPPCPGYRRQSRNWRGAGGSPHSTTCCSVIRLFYRTARILLGLNYFYRANKITPARLSSCSSDKDATQRSISMCTNDESASVALFNNHEQPQRDHPVLHRRQLACGSSHSPTVSSHGVIQAVPGHMNPVTRVEKRYGRRVTYMRLFLQTLSSKIRNDPRGGSTNQDERRQMGHTGTTCL